MYDDEEGIIRFGKLILKENEDYNSPGVIVEGPFWTLGKETREKILSGWITALNEISDKSLEFKSLKDLQDEEALKEPLDAIIYEFPKK